MPPTSARAWAEILVKKPADLICRLSRESSTSESLTHGVFWWFSAITARSAFIEKIEHWPPRTAMLRPRSMFCILKAANWVR